MNIFKKEKQRYEVFLPTGMIRVEFDDYGCIQFKLDRELREWLNSLDSRYDLAFEDKTGKRWIDFESKTAATNCKLVFG